MNRTSRQGTALALVLALAGGACAPAMAAAPAPALPYGNTVSNDVTTATAGSQADVTLAGNGNASTVGRDATDDVVGANAVVQGSVGENRLYEPQPVGPDGVIPADEAARPERPNDRLGRYYGSSRSDNDDLTASAYGDDPQNAVRGKTTLRPRRLGVFEHQQVSERRLIVKPYIEAGQVVDAVLSSPSSVVTYSLAAVGTDVLVNGNNNQGVVSLRYERRFGEGGNSARSYGSGSGDTLSGIAHLSSAIVPNTLRVDYGGYANRTYVTAAGAALPASTGLGQTSQLYAAYVGPALTTHVGEAAVDAHYHVGYSSVGTPTSGTTPKGAVQADSVAQTSLAQDARLAIGTRPGDVAPVGLGADAGYYHERVNVLDQKLHDFHARGEVTIPVSDTTAVVGGAGYEDVRVSSHDAVRNPDGSPKLTASGGFITNYATPAYIAFDTRGLIWDAGVIWRPSRRTNLEAHVGRRYGGFSGFGTFSYQPTERLSFNTVVYDDVTGFGGALNNSLFDLPNQFQAVRDGVTGNVSSCLAQQGATNCLGGVLGSISSTVHRDRGVTMGWGYDNGRIQTGFGGGYDRHTYIAAPETVFASLNGKVDQYYWVAAYLSGSIDRQTLFETTMEAYRFRTNVVANGNLTSIRAVGLLQHHFSEHLSGNAALSIDEINRQALDDIWNTSGSVGMRYTF